MKKTFGFCALFLVLAASAFPAQFSLKLTGGLNWVGGDDYNAGIKGLYDFLAATYPPVSGTFSTLTSGMKLQGEAVLWFTPNIGLGFGAGYTRIKKDDTVTFVALTTGTLRYAPELSVIPLFLNAHYLYPAASFLDIDFYGGPVLFLTSVKFNRSNKWLFWDLQDSFESTGAALGFQAGLGLEFKLASAIALVLDASYHFGRLNEVKGTYTQRGQSFGLPDEYSSDSVYLWKYNDSGYDRIELDTEPPSDGAGKAVLNLSGIALSAGFKIIF